VTLDHAEVVVGKVIPGHDAQSLCEPSSEERHDVCPGRALRREGAQSQTGGQR